MGLDTSSREPRAHVTMEVLVCLAYGVFEGG